MLKSTFCFFVQATTVQAVVFVTSLEPDIGYDYGLPVPAIPDENQNLTVRRDMCGLYPSSLYVADIPYAADMAYGPQNSNSSLLQVSAAAGGRQLILLTINVN